MTISAQGLTRVFDASAPPAVAPAGVQGVLGYIGRAGKTPHVWTLEEWQPFAALRQFPCWVPDLSADPAGEAAAAAGAMTSLGWSRDLPAASTRALVADLETAGGNAVAAWWARFSDAVHVNGFVAVAYGSLSTVLTVAASWVWAADWDGQATLGEGQTVVGHQDAANVAFAGTRVDYSVISPWLALRGGSGPRHAVR